MKVGRLGDSILGMHKEAREIDLKGIGNARQLQERRIPLPSLNPTQVAEVYFSPKSELLLSQALLLSEVSNIRTYNSTPVHH